MTIFGPPFDELQLEDVQAFLDRADDEGLLWEAKGTELRAKEVRRQACAFANSHEGGYLILGADPGEEGWRLDGVEFPGGEPRTWVTDVTGDPERGVRPRPDFDVQAWPAEKGHVAVVEIRPTATPPCMTHGTVYERLPGKAQTVRDPTILAGLFARGDEARKKAQARADRAAVVVMEALDGPAGEFRTVWHAIDPGETAEERDEPDHVRHVVAVAATGNPYDISSRLFKDEFAEDIWRRLQDLPTFAPPPFTASPESVDWSQDALICRLQIDGPVPSIAIVRAAWDGSVAVGRKRLAEDVHLEPLTENEITPDWRLADELVQCLRGFGDVYVTVCLDGGRFPRRRGEHVSIVIKRGPLLPGVDDRHVGSLRRELSRAVGNHIPEP